MLGQPIRPSPLSVALLVASSTRRRPRDFGLDTDLSSMWGNLHAHLLIAWTLAGLWEGSRYAAPRALFFGFYGALCSNEVELTSAMVARPSAGRCCMTLQRLCPRSEDTSVVSLFMRVGIDFRGSQWEVGTISSPPIGGRVVCSLLRQSATRQQEMLAMADSAYCFEMQFRASD